MWSAAINNAQLRIIVIKDIVVSGNPSHFQVVAFGIFNMQELRKVLVELFILLAVK